MNELICDRCLSNKTLNVLELYSGIGGMHQALKLAIGDDEIERKFPLQFNVTAVDLNDSANRVYRLNFPKTSLLQRNIVSLKADELDSIKIDLLTMSPPCQPFTRNGLQKDIDDPRNNSLAHLLKEVLPKMKNLPEMILVENVKNFETSEARESLVTTITQLGYVYQEFLINPLEINIPNSRLRYYLIGRKSTENHNPFLFEPSDEFFRSFPVQDIHRACCQCVEKFKIQNFEKVEMKTLRDYLEPLLMNDATKAYQYFVKRPEKNFRAMDVVDYDSQRSCCFTRSYGSLIVGTGSILVTNTIFKADNLTADMDEIERLGLRFFTPREIANLMHFSKDFKFPNDFTEKQKYRLLGNSINVKVVSVLMKFLMINKIDS